MVCSTARESIGNARQRIRNNSSNGSGMCLMDTRGHLEIDSLHPDAQSAWEDLDPADRVRWDEIGRNPNKIPPGAPVWSSGSGIHGHIFLSMRISQRTHRRLFATNDKYGNGQIDYVDINFFTDHWGHTILGYGKELNRTGIPYLRPLHAADGRLRVRLAVMKPGKHNPDVRILERRLVAEGFPVGEKGLKVDGVFGDNTRMAVRQFQQRRLDLPKKDADGIPGPMTAKALGLRVVG